MSIFAFRFLALPHPGLAIYRHCIELESNFASTGNKAGLANARKLYESALSTYDQDANLWRDYHCMEIKVQPQSILSLLHKHHQKIANSGASFLNI